MTKSTLSSASVVLFGVAVAAVLIFSTGCEWESSGSEGSWSDSMSWINFGGTYRSGSGSRPLVSNYSLSSGNLGSDVEEPDPELETVYHTVNGELLAETDIAETVFNGIIDYAPELDAAALAALGISRSEIVSMRLAPGTVTLALSGGTMGSTSDLASDGVLSGAWSQFGVEGSSPLVGAVVYETGEWRIELQPPGDPTGESEIRTSYRIEVVIERGRVDGGAGGDDGDDGYDTGIYTLQVEQTGNRLRFTDNSGNNWEGQLFIVTVPGGDSSGRTSGDVIGNFEVNGSGARSAYSMVGAFRGVYVRDSGLQSGMINQREIQGTWLEPGWQGDLYGVARDNISVQISGSEAYSPATE